MTDYDPMSSFVQQLPGRQRELMQRVGPGGPSSEQSARKFVEAKMELQRANWACQIGLQLRHGLLKKVASKL